MGIVMLALCAGCTPSGMVVQPGATYQVLPDVKTILNDAGFRCAWHLGTGERLECDGRAGGAAFAVSYIETAGGQELVLGSVLPQKRPARLFVPTNGLRPAEVVRYVTWWEQSEVVIRDQTDGGE